MYLLDVHTKKVEFFLLPLILIFYELQNAYITSGSTIIPLASPRSCFSRRSLVADIQTDSSSSSSKNFVARDSLSSTADLRWGKARLTCCHRSCTMETLLSISATDLEDKVFASIFCPEFVRLRSSSCFEESSSSACCKSKVDDNDKLCFANKWRKFIL